MFSKCIDELTLSNELANQAFGNIQGEAFNGDNSFVATLRALLLPRIGDAKVALTFRESCFSRNDIESVGFDAMISATIGILYSDSLIIHNLYNSNRDARQAFYDRMDDPENGFVKTVEGFHEMVNIREFVAEVMETRFYTNETTRTTVIVVGQLSAKKWHYLQSFIPRYFKWYFQNSPITEEEKALLSSLFQRTPDTYERLIEQFADKFDMRALVIKDFLGEFERRSRRVQLDETENTISRTQSDIDSTLARYQELIERLDDLNIRRTGLREIINGAPADSELIDYFTIHKDLDIVSVDGSRMSLIVRTYLDSFDPEMYESMAARETSHLFRDYDVRNSNFRSIENRKKLLDAIFSSEPTLRVKMCAYYVIDTRGSVDTRSGYRFPANCNEMMPNPHLQYHNCLGNHRRYIVDRLRAGDTIGAIEQCVASAKSLNVGEGATMTYFLRDLFGTNKKIIELPDGTSVSPVEALAWLNNET